MRIQGSSRLQAADVLRSAIPLALIAVAAVVPASSPVVLLVLVGGLAVAAGRAAPVRWSWAAPVPVAVDLTWRLVTSSASAANALGADCTVLASPPAAWAVAEAALVLAVVAGLLTVLRAEPSSLALRMPARRWLAGAFGGTVVLAVIGVAGVLLASQALGGVRVAVRDPGFLAPALLFAAAVGITEELAYRGALLHWAARAVGTWPALVAQAVVYGLAHGLAPASESPILLVTILGASGFLAGLIAVRTRSLLVPILWHAALNVGLYAYLACRA